MLNWMNDLHPDPNDPNNVSFFEALKVCIQIKYINMKITAEVKVSLIILHCLNH